MPRVILIEYFVMEDRTLIFTARDDFEKPEVHEVVLPADRLRENARQRFGESSATDRTGTSLRSLIEADFHAFFAPFVAPLGENTRAGDPLCADGDIIWFVPHDVLHYVPLHAVMVNGTTVIERHPVCYTPSASVMRFCRQQRRARMERALILAYSPPDEPVPHAVEQARVVEQLFAPHARVFTGDAATQTALEAQFAAGGDGIDLLHLACHGYFDQVQPLHSGVRLAPDGAGKDDGAAVGDESDGSLTAQQILALHLPVSLVTLSACESGVNQQRPGDELFGLTRALLYAGAPSIAVTLWKVADLSTSLLMQSFYRHLRTGEIKARALQQAQLELRALTAGEAVAYCEQIGERLTDPVARRRLEWDLAFLRFRARDFDGAMEGYQALLAETDPAGQEYLSLLQAVTHCQMAGRQPQSVDYGVRLYDHLYYWAPFVLIGDWQ